MVATASLFAGWKSDALIRRGVSPTLVRKAAMLIGHTTAAIGLADCCFATLDHYLVHLALAGIGGRRIPRNHRGGDHERGGRNRQYDPARVWRAPVTRCRRSWQTRSAGPSICRRILDQRGSAQKHRFRGMQCPSRCPPKRDGRGNDQELQGSSQPTQWPPWCDRSTSLPFEPASGRRHDESGHPTAADRGIRS